MFSYPIFDLNHSILILKGTGAVKIVDSRGIDSRSLGGAVKNMASVLARWERNFSARGSCNLDDIKAKARFHT